MKLANRIDNLQVVGEMRFGGKAEIRIKKNKREMQGCENNPAMLPKTADLTVTQKTNIKERKPLVLPASFSSCILLNYCRQLPSLGIALMFLLPHNLCLPSLAETPGLSEKKKKHNNFLTIYSVNWVA
jgi:hypothetical protein